ncbi:hypothetical protein K1719_011972 [Acacia pycnantha]|nr:hypothetical protein K1719_011972 [Acacia pycnantha]
MMEVKNDVFGEYDWCSFVFNELCNSMREYKKELMKGKLGRKNVGGGLYFLMIDCLQHSPPGKLKACKVEDAITYWNGNMVNNRVKLENESTKGLLHGLGDCTA